MEPEEPPLSAGDTRALRFLRGLVTALTLTMIAGMAVLVFLFLTRFPQPSGGLGLPDTLDLPAGATVVSVTRGPDFWAVTTDAGEVLVYEGGAETPSRRLRLPEVD